MYQRSGKAALAVIILLIAGTVLAQTKTVEEIVARVNADIILKSELDRAKDRLRADLGEAPPRVLGHAVPLEQVTDVQVVARATRQQHSIGQAQQRRVAHDVDGEGR